MENNTEESLLLSLPEELLVNIFSKVDSPRELGRLAQTCRKLRSLIKQNSMWNVLARNILISNQHSEEMKLRCPRTLLAVEKVKIHHMWLHYQSFVEPCIKFKKMYQPIVKIHDYKLWYTQGSVLHWINRRMTGELYKRRKDRGRIDMHTNDITSVQFLPTAIVTGARDGKVNFYCQENKRSICSIIGPQEIVDLCCYDNVLVYADQVKQIHVYKIDSAPVLKRIHSIGDHVWKIALVGHRLYVTGSAGMGIIHPLQVFDIETNSKYADLGPKPPFGAGTFCLKQESNNEILSGSFHAEVHLWDLRTPQHSVILWEDMYNSSIRSIDTDHRFTVITGTQDHNVINIYDKRQPNRTIHNMYVARRNSPVYSLVFEPMNLYAALDLGIFNVSFGKY